MAKQILLNCDFDSTQIKELWIGSKVVNGDRIVYPLEYTTSTNESVILVNWHITNVYTNVMQIGSQYIQMYNVTAQDGSVTFDERLTIGQNGKIYEKNLSFSLTKNNYEVINKIKDVMVRIEGEYGISPVIAYLVDENDNNLLVGYDRALFMTELNYSLTEDNIINVAFQSNSISRARSCQISYVYPLPD